jgi:hypothetical protein
VVESVFSVACPLLAATCCLFSSSDTSTVSTVAKRNVEHLLLRKCCSSPRKFPCSAALCEAFIYGIVTTVHFVGLVLYEMNFEGDIYILTE